MLPDWFLAIVLALIAASGGWLTYLTTRRSADSGRLDRLQARVEVLEGRQLRLINYAYRLRHHIDTNVGPPAPDWPDDIFDDGSK